jgi:GT2 family glycosyltransferase
MSAAGGVPANAEAATLTRVAAVIVSWNQLHLLPACLAALRGQSLGPTEVVVVDNGSIDGSVEWLRRQPDIELVTNPMNTGFAAANNQGIGVTRAEVVLLLNVDVELAPDYLELCVRRFDESDIGSVTGKLLRGDPPHTIDSTGHAVYGLGWAENRGEMLPDSGYDQSGEVFGVCAAAAVYRRAALEMVVIDGQYLDESYFSYIEDVDLDWRLRWAGWRAWYEPQAIAIHHRSASGARRTSRIMRHILKNRILTVVKNYDGRSLVTNLPGLAMFTAIKTVDFARDHPSALLGLLDAARLMPTAVRRRRQIRKGRRVAPGMIRPWLLRFPWRDRVRRRLARAG